jgi:ABC-2 type transport system permease protein
MVNAALGSLTIWALAGPPEQPLGFLIAIPALLGAWILNFAIYALIGLAAFVTEDVTAFVWIVQKFAFVFGGLLIPLDFYPAWLQAVARALPFSAMVYAPARLFVDPTPAAFLDTLGIQLAWILALGLLTSLAYRKGVAILTVNGG